MSNQSMSLAIRKRYFVSVFLLSLCNLNDASAKDFGKLPAGKMISCLEAVHYRDNILIKEYDAIVVRYADGTVDRQKLLQEKLEVELKKLDAQWSRTSDQLKKRVAGQWVAITLSVVGSATASWAKAKVTAQDKEAVGLLVERATNSSAIVANGTIGKQVSVSDVALLPVSAVVAVAFPPASLGITVLSIGLGVIDQIENLADLNLEEAAYRTSADVLKTALRNLALKSVTNQLRRLSDVKNEIDRACG